MLRKIESERGDGDVGLKGGERGEVWQDKGSYAAEGQLLVVEWMTNRLSAAKKWRYSSDAAQLKIWPLARART